MSAPVKKRTKKKKKTNKIKQRTSTTTIFVKMLSTDLVPVHNDIWRKLPLFLKGVEPSLWRRQKGHGSCDLNTDSEVFSTVLHPVWSGWPQIFLYTLPPFHWSDPLDLYLSLPGVLERCQNFGSMSEDAQTPTDQQRLDIQTQGFVDIFHHSLP